MELSRGLGAALSILHVDIRVRFPHASLVPTSALRLLARKRIVLNNLIVITVHNVLSKLILTTLNVHQ